MGVAGTIDEAALLGDDLELHAMDLGVLGGTFRGEARLHNFERFAVKGEVRDVVARHVALLESAEPLPWDALVSGPLEGEGSFARHGGLRASDREVRGAPLAVAVGAALHLDVTVSKNCGGVRARAVRDGAAVVGAKMVMLLSGTVKEPGELKQDFTNDEGELSFTGLTPGRYLLWAWAVEGKGAIAGPASLAAVERQATIVEVKEGEPVATDVPLLKEEGQAP